MGGRPRDGRDGATSQGHLGPPEAGRGRWDPPLEPRRERGLKGRERMLFTFCYMSVVYTWSAVLVMQPQETSAASSWCEL